MEDLHPYTVKMLGVLDLQRAGYPLGAEDLTADEWMDLGRLKACLQM